MGVVVVVAFSGFGVRGVFDEALEGVLNRSSLNDNCGVSLMLNILEEKREGFLNSRFRFPSLKGE